MVKYKNIKNHKEDSNISSSEMTAHWRSIDPEFSGDNISKKLSSANGILRAHQFEEKYSYPLVGRKVSVRAGWCLEQALELFSTKKYDSCISLGSGFSLLTYLIARNVLNNQNINFIDVDLPEILNERNLRIQDLGNNENLETSILERLTTLAMDLEYSYNKGDKFEDIFGTNKSPVFILEGIIYFLSRDCVRWIFKEISKFKNHAVIFDYWPYDALEKSECFRKMFDSLNRFIPEQIKGLLDENELNYLCGNAIVKNISLQEVENSKSFMKGESPRLIDLNEFIPVRFSVIKTI